MIQRVQYLSSDTDADSTIPINSFLLFKAGIIRPIPKDCIENIFYRYAHMYTRLFCYSVWHSTETPSSPWSTVVNNIAPLLVLT